MPDWKQILREQLVGLRLAPEREAEIVEELAQDLEQRYAEALAGETSPQSAQHAVLRELENSDRLARAIREAEFAPLPRPLHAVQAARRAAAREIVAGRMRGNMFANFIQDVRYALRTFGKNPGFTFIAVVTLALGIGANTAIFSAVNGVLLKPLPFAQPDRLVWMWGKFSGGQMASTSPPDFLDYRAQSKSIESMAASIGGTGRIARNLTGIGEPVRLNGAIVTYGYFETLGVKPAMGRSFLPGEDQNGKNDVAILSDSLWRTRFGADPQILGKVLTIDRRPTTVVGVMPATFDFPAGAQIWMPFYFGAEEASVRRFHYLRPVLRLKPGVSIAQAQAELNTIAQALEKTYPDSNTTWRVRLEPLTEVIVGNVRQPLTILLGAVGLVLLIACGNVASLLLARGAARQREIAIRVALGASRARIAAQMLTESVLLAAGGAAIGLLLAWWSVGALRAANPSFLPRVEEIQLDTWTLSFTLACALLTGLIFGVVPAYSAARGSAQDSLKEGGRSIAGGTRQGLRRALVVAEVAFSIVLLIGAGLLLKTFWNLTRVSLGFDPQGLVTTSLALTEERYPKPEQRAEFLRHVLDNVRSIPGVNSAAAGNGTPLSGWGDTYFTIQGRPPLPDGQKANAVFRTVTAGYFRTLGSPILKGREFNEQDTADSSKVVVISDAFARQFFPNEEPIGKVLNIDVGEPFLAEIVGVVTGTRQNIATEPQPEMSILAEQQPLWRPTLVIRAAGDISSIAPAVRAAVWSVDKEQTLDEFVTMRQRVEQSRAQEEFSATLLGIFAGVALALAATGLYGVIAYSVAQRTHEIGIRVALGARARDVLLMVFRQGMLLALLGVAAGVAGAWALTRWMRQLLFGVTPTDPVIFAVVATMMLAVALAACWIPARRATRVDPLVALRYE